MSFSSCNWRKKLGPKVLVEVSSRHIHLSQKDLGALFGKGYKLKKLRPLSQEGEFAAKETLNLRVGKREIKEVRIVGPVRKETQVELSKTDAIYLKINPPLRMSGDINNTPGITLVNPRNKKKIKIKQGVIIPWRHLHCGTKEAKKLHLKNNSLISVKIEGERKLIFNNVRVRIKDNFRLAVHLDTDEGNSAGIIKKGEGYLILDNF